MTANIEHHERLVQELTETYKRKNRDYGDSFHIGYNKFGLTMALIRIGDKYNRFETLARLGNPNVKDESIRDTLMDMANYCVMTAMELERTKMNEFENKSVDLNIEVVYHGFDENEKIQKLSVGDWIDLRAAEDVDMVRGDYKMISLGVSMRLPDGYEAHVLPRSSTFKKYGITMVNGMGIIDNSYSGTNDIWKFSALCHVEKTHISKGERIAQFRIFENMKPVSFAEVTELNDVDRGGFGSTGRN